MKQKREKGITLIALVITIIVLLILAGIAIATLTGENGILTKANNAKTQNDKAGAKEKVQIAVMGSFDENGKIDINTLKNNLKQTEGVTRADSITKLPATVKVDGYDVTIDKNGNVTLGIIEEQTDPIYARVYTKDGSDEEVLILASNESAIPDYSGELTLKKDYKNINDINRYKTKEDLYEIPEYKEIFESEEWKQFENEYPEQANQWILELIEDIKTSRGAPWSEEVSMDRGGSYYASTVCEIRILDKINPSNIKGWFSGYKVKTIKGLENLNTSNVTDMSFMFAFCNCEDLDLSKLDTSNVVNMKWMFYRCLELTQLDLKGFDTSNVTDMERMFCYCEKLTSIDLQSFDTSNVANMKDMFSYCKNLPSINLQNFNTSKVRNMDNMFDFCQSLISLDLKSFDTSLVGGMNCMFRECGGLTQLDLSNFNTSNVWDMSSMFAECDGLVKLDLSNFDTSNVTDMGSMFMNCSNLTQVNVSSFNTQKVTSMFQMFRGCSSLTTLDLTSFSTNASTDTFSMFQRCDLLTKVLIGREWKASETINGITLTRVEE
ncbi:MAG: BspA family leucine-rich repeat surface protein [Clostridia bacterium]|nr:BspA family leucine-rich repeat surface protein [Clostridia bacterium]